MLRKLINSIFHTTLNPKYNEPVISIYDKIPNDMELYGNINAYKKPNIYYTNDSIDGGEEKEEPTYKYYKASEVY